MPVDATVPGGAARVFLLGTDITPAPSTTGPPAGGSAVFTLRVTAQIHIGVAQITWRHDGTPLALWTLNAELD